MKKILITFSLFLLLLSACSKLEVNPEEYAGDPVSSSIEPTEEKERGITIK